MIGDLAGLGQHRRHQQVLRSGVGRTLGDVQRLLTLPGRRHGQGGLADTGRTEQTRRQRPVAGVNHQPTGQQLAQDLVLADPAQFGGVGGAEMQDDALHLSGCLGS